jgi:hypothetical protein
MTDSKSAIGNFLQRWSRRKHAAAQPPKDAAEEQSNEDAASAPPAPSSTLTPEALPPIETIAAGSDIRSLLRPGVPEDVRRAALRRAWAADPAVRDFIGIADNQWDFTTADGVPGFGPLAWTPDVERLVTELFGDTPPPLPSLPPSESATGPAQTISETESAPRATQAGSGAHETNANKRPS